MAKLKTSSLNWKKIKQDFPLLSIAIPSFYFFLFFNFQSCSLLPTKKIIPVNLLIQTMSLEGQGKGRIRVSNDSSLFRFENIWTSSTQFDWYFYLPLEPMKNLVFIYSDKENLSAVKGSMIGSKHLTLEEEESLRHHLELLGNFLLALKEKSIPVNSKIDILPSGDQKYPYTLKMKGRRNLKLLFAYTAKSLQTPRLVEFSFEILHHNVVLNFWFDS